MGRENFERQGIEYYSRPGYLHRYYLTTSPHWKTIANLSTNDLQDSIEKKINYFKEKEDKALISFANLFVDEGTAQKGLDILNGLLTDSNTVFDIVWKEISTKGLKNTGLEKKIGSVSKEALHETALEKVFNEETKETKQLTKQIKTEITKEMNQLLGPQGGMKFSKSAATLGNWFERYFSMLITASYINKVLKEQPNLEGWKRAMAVAGTVSHFSGKELLSAQTGDSKYGLKESTYDILLNRFDRENPLPIQMKAGSAGGKNVLSLPPTSLDLLINDTIEKGVSDVIKFAIIHQHAFSDPNYISLVEGVNERRKAEGITPTDTYVIGSNPNAIERLSGYGLIDNRFFNVISVLRYSIAIKAIAGIGEGQEALIYVISKTGTKTKGHTRDAVLRVSDMLTFFLGTPSKVKSNPWPVKQTGDSLKDIPQDILTMYEEDPLETREEWYNATSGKLLSAVNKIKLSMEFNYANMGG